MTSKATVKSIVVQFPDGQTKELSIEDARALYKQLEDLFGIHYIEPRQPIIIERQQWPWWWNPVTVVGPVEPATIPAQPFTEEVKVWCMASE